MIEKEIENIVEIKMKKAFVEQTKALQAQHMLPRGVPKGVSMQFHLRGRDKKSGPFSLKEIC